MIYQDTDSRITYSAAEWTIFTVAEAEGGTLTATDVAQARFSFYFQGSDVALIYAQGPEGGPFFAQLSNGQILTGNSYGETYSYGHRLLFTDLPDDIYRLTLVNGENAMWLEGVQINGELLDLPEIEVVGADDVPLASAPVLPAPNAVTIPIDPSTQDFEDSIYGENEAIPTLAGFPNYAIDDPDTYYAQWGYDYGLSQAALAYQYNTLAGDPLNLVVDLALSSDPTETFVVTDLTLLWAQVIVNYQPREFTATLTYELLDPNGQVLFSDVCNRLANGSRTCTYPLTFGAEGVEGVSRVRLTHQGSANDNHLINLAFFDDINIRRREALPVSCLIDMKAITDFTGNIPPVSQEGMDMFAYANLDGLIIHSAPIINAVRSTSSNVGLRQQAGIYHDYIPWGTTDLIVERIVSFPLSDPLNITNPNQLWYKVIYDDGLNTNTSKSSGWIIGSLVDDPLGQLDYVDDTTHNCKNKTDLQLRGSNTVTFYYDREMATTYAIEQAYINNDNTGTNYLPDQHRVTAPPITNLPYYDFEYPQQVDNFDVNTGHTGSAPFISEMFWVGGLPTTLIEDFETCDTENDTTQDTQNKGWRYCGEANLASNVWGNHQEILGYYIQGHQNYPSNGYRMPETVNLTNNWISRRSIALILPSETYLYASQGQMVQNTSRPRIVPNFLADVNYDWFFTPERDLSNFVDLHSGTVDRFVITDFYSWLTTDRVQSVIELGDVRYGDYVYVNSRRTDPSNKNDKSDNHGFLIIGWGPIQDCEMVLTSSFSLGNSIFPDSVSAPANSVPYVVDFPGSRFDPDELIRLQAPVPRPFYCSRYDANGVDSYFTDEHSWFFVTMPNQITIPVDRLYVLLN